MRPVYVILLICIIALQTLASVAAAQTIPPYVVPAWWEKAGVVRLIDTVVDKQVTTPDGQSNTNVMRTVTTGGEPLIVIDSWWFKQEVGNVTWYCQSVVGLRGYAMDFPRVVVKINKLNAGWWQYSTGIYHYTDLPILVLGHQEDARALVARIKGEFNPTGNTWQFGILVGVYNFETDSWEQYVEIWPFGNSTALPVYLDLIPEFYSIDDKETNTTTVIYGWKLRVWSNQTGFAVYQYNATYKIAYENITVPTPVTLNKLSKFVEKMRGWYVWVGAGLSVYVGGRDVRYCEIATGSVSNANWLSEYVLGYPLVENWRVDIKKLYDAFVSGKLEKYEGPEVSVQKIAAEQNWGNLYSAIIPWAFGLAIGFVIMQASKSRAAGTAGAIGTDIAIGWLMGWSPITVVVGLIGAGAALYVLMSSGEE